MGVVTFVEEQFTIILVSDHLTTKVMIESSVDEQSEHEVISNLDTHNCRHSDTANEDTT